MALTVTLTGTTVTLDETAGLQNDDTNAALPAAFSSRLTALGAPATAINAAVSNGNVISISGATGTISNLAFTDGNGGALDGDSSGLFDHRRRGDLPLHGHGERQHRCSARRRPAPSPSRSTSRRPGARSAAASSGASSTRRWSIRMPPTPMTRSTWATNLTVAASEEINFGFAGAPSGSNLFMTFGDPTSTQIVVIGKNPLNQSQGGTISTKDVLNISQAGSTTSFGVNGNQINPDEGAFITYVTGTNTNFLVPNLDQNEADVEANIDFQNVVDATTASFTVNQTNPGVGPVTVKITAFNTAAEPGVNFVDGLTNDTQVNITSASVVDFVVKTGNTQFTPVATVNADGTLTVTGLSTGDEVRWTTSGTHNRVLIENISNADGISGNDNNTFDIGGFSISTPNAASAVVGTAVHFEDDGPTAAIVQGAATVAHDETAGVMRMPTTRPRQR